MYQSKQDWKFPAKNQLTYDLMFDLIMEGKKKKEKKGGGGGGEQPNHDQELNQGP